MTPGPGSPAAAEAADELVRRLNVAKKRAGNPSLARLARVLGYTGASTVSRIFTGKVRPSAYVLEKLAGELQVSKDVFTNQWMPLWDLACSAPVRRGPAPRATGSTPEGFECPACGSWVTNPQKHIAWHTEFNPRATSLRTAV